MRYLVVGAGSIGCYIGGLLLASDRDVTLLGRPRIINDLSEHGLTVTHYSGVKHNVTLTPSHLSTDPNTLSAHFDVVLLCVKSQDSSSALASISDWLTTNTVIVSLQNGLRNEELIKRGFPDLTVLPGMVPFNVVNLGKGRFHCGSEGALTLPEHNVALDIVEAIYRAGVNATTSHDIRSVQYGKLLMNLNNALNALSDIPLKQQLEDRDYRRVLAASIAEALKVMDKSGIKPARVGKVLPKLLPFALRLPNGLFKLLAKGMLKIDPKARSSMWEDLQAKRAPEIDYLNGEIVLLGKEAGVSTPVNQEIVNLIKKAFENGESPAYTGDVLLSKISK